jgi:hypothetical protein
VRAGGSERGQRFAGLAKLVNLLVEGGNARLREPPRARPVVRRIQLQQLADLGKRESSRLRGADELEPPDVVRAIAPDLAGWPRWLGKLSPALIITHRFDPHAGSFRKAADRVRIFRLIPYHGTEAIEPLPGANQRGSGTGETT